MDLSTSKVSLSEKPFEESAQRFVQREAYAGFLESAFLLSQTSVLLASCTLADLQEKDLDFRPEEPFEARRPPEISARPPDFPFETAESNAQLQERAACSIWASQMAAGTESSMHLSICRGLGFV